MLFVLIVFVFCSAWESLWGLMRTKHMLYHSDPSPPVCFCFIGQINNLRICRQKKKSTRARFYTAEGGKVRYGRHVQDTEMRSRARTVRSSSCLRRVFSPRPMLIALFALYQSIPTAAQQADNRGKEGLIGLGDLFNVYLIN